MSTITRGGIDMRVIVFFKRLWAVRNIFFIIIAFVSPVSFLIHGTLELRCAYVVVAVATLWLTEALPIYVTALLPIFLLPMLRIQSSDTVCRNYVNETSMLYLGGFILAVGMEEVNLHKRIAIGVAKLFGSSANTLLLALTLTTGFLSMWISNAAAACMMMPIVKAIVEEIISAEKGEKETKMETDLYEVEIKESNACQNDVNMEVLNTKVSDEEGEHMRMGKALALCVAYAASIGGNATLTGSSSNIILLGQADIFYKTHGLDDSGITYGAWMGFSVPLALILLIVTWVVLKFYFLRNSNGNRRYKYLVLKDIYGYFVKEHTKSSRKYTEDTICRINILSSPACGVYMSQMIRYARASNAYRDFLARVMLLTNILLAQGYAKPRLVVVIKEFYKFHKDLVDRICTKSDEARRLGLKKALRKEYEKLGDVKCREIIVLILFCTQAMLLLTRDLPNIGGWGNAFLDDEGKSTVKDSAAAIFVASLLFFIPEKMPNIICWYKDGDKEKILHQKPILTWQSAWKRISSDTIFLIGGGFALADACTSSGLSNTLVCKLQVFGNMVPWVMNLLLCFVVAAITEIMSNTALFTLLAPIMFELAIAVRVHPLYLMMSSCIASSFAFMLPVGTPPMAIAFSTGYLKIKDMVLVGMLTKIIAILCLILSINTWGPTIFDLETFPGAFRNSSYISACEKSATIANITSATGMIQGI